MAKQTGSSTPGRLVSTAKRAAHGRVKCHRHLTSEALPMIVTSYPAEDLYALIPDALQYHDPLLVALDPLIDEAMVAQVRADVCRRWPQSATRGRPSTPAEVI